MAGVDRRTVLKGVGGAAALGLSGVALKYGFNTPDREQDPASCSAADVSDKDKRLVFSNWPEYIDEDDKDYVSTKTQFEKDTGIKVSYTADVNDNNEFFAKVSNQLGSCSSSKRDLFALTDWMAARMIQVGWIQKLDASKVPNLHANILDSLKSPEWDPKREYSAPWQSGLTGIAYNKAKVGEIKSFKELLTRKDLRGRISLLTEMRDTMAFLLLINGADPEKFDDDEWQDALDLLKKARSDGQVRSFTGNSYVQDLAAGNILACEAWSGDIANAGDENLVWIPPEEGIIIWADNMLVPNLATHQGNAEAWIDYYYQPEVAAKLADYNSYICPVKGAQEAMEKVNPDNVENELIFPTSQTLDKTHRFMALDEATMRTYEGDFADVTGA
ncbi:polyamine ABC transporter substrate-binding protein [Aeromicrobium chenweiae]|uniref:ABC transporter substrate-binding protein n=1 Tax=Aeromicrobium chenweiae TaxID=2079793 RepID=A0A2S0WN59_9ACTN|nr:spermidine/putrescine ABC transporter substrate-binding protein [Aeromicrobium chenweiae]AWB92783.1 ABC transporter substrate-binding protein [Aeromicrobium chenweiae]TGN33776.1 spermidine/putrescine ABC transporter substrate-binding protein [Aeromicrobium chenweiae]